jgi:hypothetical protein
VNSMPPLSGYNRFACLEVDTIIEPRICVANSTEVVQNPLPSPYSKPTQSHSSLGVLVTRQICCSSESGTDVPHGGGGD